jgi:protease-4
MNFFRSFFAALLALFVFTFLAIILLIGWLAGMASEQQVIIKDNSVLHLKLDEPIAELQRENPFEGLPVPVSDAGRIGLMQLKQAIEYAKNDPKIKGIYVEVSYPMTGFSTLEEIRTSLIDFRQSGKWVVAYNEVMSEGAYYLATAADKIYLNPEGDLEFNGLTIEISFFKRLFDKLEIKPQIFRVGEFKSAVEPFMLEKMSAENRLQLDELANSLYDHVLTQISASRSIPVERLEELSDKMMVRDAKKAKEYGLVDDLFYTDQFLDDIRNRLGIGEKEDIRLVKYGKYRKSIDAANTSKNEIAVIVAEGTIMPGESEQQQDMIGAETFVDEIRKAREDDDIKAIVLRINSPGGEFRSSDMMWRELQLARKVKPVIASMSDYAASGGYYLAMGCDTIVAQPNTITGSIGIFGMMFDMSDFLGNKIGVTFDEVRTGDFGEMYTVSRPLTEAEKNFWQQSLSEHYETFITKAAEGRGIPAEEIRKVASGRVWSGSQALEHKLIDVTGGFNEAVKIAAESAGVKDDYRVRFFPQPKSFLEQWLSDREEGARTKAIREELGEYYVLYQQLQRIRTFQGEQARMPFEFQIH